MAETTTPRILIVAGSDSGGGAGIQADIKTVTMLGGHAMTAVTAITAQNTLGVQAVQAIPAEMVVAQMRSCIDDIGVDAVKIGMIGSAATAHAVADMLEGINIPRHPGPVPGPTSPPINRSAAESSIPEPVRGDGVRIPIVFDPVMVATSGATLADAETIAAFARLIAMATVVTPNLPELAALGGRAAVLGFGCSLVEKGGHAAGAEIVDTLWSPAGLVRELRAKRIDTRSTHGTGCTFASALATGLAAGMGIEEAFARAVSFVRIALLEAPGLGHGHGPLGHQFVTDFQ